VWELGHKCRCPGSFKLLRQAFPCFYCAAMSVLLRDLPPILFKPARGRAVPDQTAVSRAFRAIAGLLSGVAELVVRVVGPIGTRTDIKQANGFLLAQESAAVCIRGG
jgi:hypothetical protein